MNILRCIKAWEVQFWVKNMVLQNYMYLKNALRYIIQIWFYECWDPNPNLGYHSNQSCRHGNKNRHAMFTNKNHEFWNRRWPLFLSRLRDVLQQMPKYLKLSGRKSKPVFLSKVSTSLLNKPPIPQLVHVFLVAAHIHEIWSTSSRRICEAEVSNVLMSHFIL